MNRLIIDAHLDLAMNAIEWNRDLSRPLDEIRNGELSLQDRPDRGKGTVCLPELRKGNVGIVVATQLARVSPSRYVPTAWNSPQQAWAMTQAQLSWYREMEALGEMVQIVDLEGLEEQVHLWNDDQLADEDKPIGYILSLEGADSLVDIDYLYRAHGYGLRAMGLSHFGTGRYADGTKTAGRIHPQGLELMKVMGALNLILDVTHLTDEGFDQALDLYEGPIWASHHNVRKFVPNQRQLTDVQIKKLIGRGAVIGGMLDCWAMDIRFIDTVSDPWQLDIRLEQLVDHWDHICQLAGNSHHIGIGSDLDGIFGTEQSPWDLNSIADLRKFEAILQHRGYSEVDIDNIFHGNWLRFLRNAWKK
ncbi:dipeptidase [Parapedobacter indicus]|uniref:Membrane dipeptidase n=1 Tax=Parapedobacter indicus TaxID=1477437 RepID=A0A1I3GVB6_9SPHI|nr:membrane dipeptidase [Parapedobacter indicus]PPL02793.1 membrane dipeptidase [Parapedobacter indicus]SFI27310.1 membrane dipeptidase [Parapedobacter indicus]